MSTDRTYRFEHRHISADTASLLYMPAAEMQAQLAASPEAAAELLYTGAQAGGRRR